MPAYMHSFRLFPLCCLEQAICESLSLGYCAGHFFILVCHTMYALFPNSSTLVLSTDGIPYAGVPVPITVGVHPALTVVCCLLAAAGIAFAIYCMIFNFQHRERKWVLSVSIGVCNPLACVPHEQISTHPPPSTITTTKEWLVSSPDPTSVGRRSGNNNW